MNVFGILYLFINIFDKNDYSEEKSKDIYLIMFLKFTNKMVYLI